MFDSFKMCQTTWNEPAAEWKIKLCTQDDDDNNNKTKGNKIKPIVYRPFQ